MYTASTCRNVPYPEQSALSKSSTTHRDDDCAMCGLTTWANPLPTVALLLQPCMSATCDLMRQDLESRQSMLYDVAKTGLNWSAC